MSLRFITGTSGQGKTTFLIDELIRRSIKEPDRQFFLIVPEQFSLEMQRRIARTHPDQGYMNIDVLSFYRLAYRVFDECSYQPDDVLEDLGVAMILRRILAEHREEFPGLARNRSQIGFLDELKSALMEIICYGVSADQLARAGEDLADYPALERKCGELAKLYQLFDETIQGRFMVTEQILSVLCDFVPGSKLLGGAVFYFDGFTGFTPVQLDFLRVLLSYAGEVNVAVTTGSCYDQILPETAHTGSGSLGKDGIEAELSKGEDLFTFSDKTIRSLIRICRESGADLMEPLCLAHALPPRFRGNPELAVLESGIFRQRRESFPGPPDRIHLTACIGPEQEAEYILHKIEYLVRKEGYRYRDFAVLTGDLSEYGAAFERQAGILHIPLFTDTKKKMSYHPSIETLRALFQLVMSNYSYESVFRYLKAGMSSMADEDVDYLENYVIASGTRGYHMWSQPFTRRLKHYTEEEAGKLNQLRLLLLQETEDFYLAWKDPNQDVKKRMTALYEQMCRLDYPGKLKALAQKEAASGKFVREKEYEEIFSLLVRLLDKIVGIFGEEKLPVKDLSELFDTGMESLGLGVVPLSTDQLILGDLKRTRLSDIRILFIAGLNEGVIPPALAEGGILTEDEKKILADHGILLAGGREEQSLEDEFYMYLAFSRPGEAIYFTYARLGRDGKAKLPSPVIKELKSIFPALSERGYPAEEKRYYFNAADSREYLLRTLSWFEDEEMRSLSRDQGLLLAYWLSVKSLHRELARYYDERQRQRSPRELSKAMAAALYGLELRGSVTRFERYASCPYQYFCIYGIGLAQREEYQVSPMDIGNLFHRALEYFSRNVKASDYRWKDMPEDFVSDLLAKAVLYAVEEEGGEVLQSTARNRYRIHSVERILNRTIRVIRAHLDESDLEPDRFELHFGKGDRLESVEYDLEGGSKMFLEGFVDRIDIYEEEDAVLVRVIDYKSGSRVFDMDDFLHGLQLQLVLYMKTVREIYGKESGKEVIPAGMYYYQLKDPILQEGGTVEDLLRKNFRMSGYTNADPSVLGKVEHRDGDFLSVSVKRNKDGQPSKTSHVLSGEGFSILLDYADQQIKEMGRQIYQGHIDTFPYRKDQQTACDYCPYRSVCGFDPKERQNYHTWKKKKEKDALEEISLLCRSR